MVDTSEQKSILQAIDMFGVGINMKIDNKEFYKTKVGGCFSILLIILMIVFATNLFQQIILKKSPTILYQQIQITQPLRHDITADQYSFTVAMLDEELMPFLDEQIFSVSAQVIHKQKVYDEQSKSYNYSLIGTDISMEVCTKNHFQEPESRDYFLSLDYSKMYCIKPDQEGLYLEGQYDAENFNMIRVKINECIDTLQCKDQLIRKKYLQNTNLQLYYVNSVVQITNLEKPFQRVGQTQFWRTNYNMIQQISLMFINTFVQDDYGLLYAEDLYQNNDLIFSSERTLQGARDPEQDKAIYQIELFMEKNKENIYKRSYMRIPQAVSQIGGIFNVFFALGCLFSKPYAKQQLYRKIINQTFSYVEEEDVKKNQQNPQKSSKVSKKIKNNLKQEYSIEQSPRKLINDIKLDSVVYSPTNKPVLADSQKVAIDQIKSQEDLLKQAETPDISRLQETNRNRMQSIQFDEKNYKSNKNEENLDSIKYDITQKQSMEEKTQKNANNQKKGHIPKQQSMFINKEKQLNSVEKDEEEEVASFLKGMFNEVKVSTKNYFKSYLNYIKCFKSNQFASINYCNQRINQFTDICSIIRKQIELQHIKYLIFNDDQYNLFKLIPKPRVDNKIMRVDPDMSMFVNNIKLQKEINRISKSQSILLNENIQKVSNMKEAQIAYKNIKELNTQENNMDEKLIEMIGKDQIKILENNKLQLVSERMIQTLTSNNQSFIKPPSSRKANESPFTQYRQQNSPKLIQLSQVQNQMKSLIESVSQISEDMHASPQRIYLQKDISIIPHHLTQQEQYQQQQQGQQRDNILIQQIQKSQQIESIQISQIMD